MLLAPAALLAVLVGGCSECPADNSITEAAFATFNLSCATNDIANVLVTGPCANADAGPQWYTGAPPVWSVGLESPSPGTCHIEIVFATGFTYAADVAFTWQGGECRHYIGPTSGPFTVNNPSDTCLDAGHPHAARRAQVEALR